MAKGGLLDLRTIAPKLAGKAGADRGFVAGRSGSGKSFLCRHLLRLYGNDEQTPLAFRGALLVIDPNHNFEFEAEEIVHVPEDIKLTRKTRSVLYRPDPERLGAEDWQAVFEKAFYYPGRLLTYVDELYAAEALFRSKQVDGGRNMLNAYLTQGRARGKGALMVAQRPVSIPKNVIGQAEYFYMFDLPIEDDRLAMIGVMGRYTADGEDLRDRNTLKKERYSFACLTPDFDDPVRMKLG